MKKLTYLAIVLVLSFELTLGSIKYETVSLYAQSNALVSIVNGASSPSISKPYDPSPLTIKPGTSVTWTNNDSTVHTVTSGLPEQGEVGTLFDSSIISPGKTFTHAFDKTGTFDYSCTLHPFMRGQIIAK
jgi:plastocyanin